MKNRNRIISALFIIGVILYLAVQGIIIPGNAKKQEEYKLAQLDATTQDLKCILVFKSPYMGDASNDINLFYNLPLSINNMTFHIIPEEFTLEVNYKEELIKVGKISRGNRKVTTDKSSGNSAGEDTQNDRKEVYKDLIYNSTAAFALIDNLDKINYNFTDVTYSVTRESIEKLYDLPLTDLLSKEHWKAKVQNQLKDSEFIDKSIKNTFIVK
jgi:hypothetical protein